MNATHTIDKERLKQPSKITLNCAKTVFMAMANEQLMRERIEPIQRKVLKMIDARDKDTNEPIREEKHTYRMSEAQFKEYMEETRHDYAKIGYHSDRYQKEGICPLLEAQSLVREAKRALVLSLEEVTGITYDDICYSLKNYRKYIELNLSYLAQFVKEGLK